MTTEHKGPRPEVGAPQIEGKELPVLPARGQRADIGDVGLDVGAGVGVTSQAPIDLHDHSLLYVLELLVTRRERKYISDLSLTVSHLRQKPAHISRTDFSLSSSSGD